MFFRRRYHCQPKKQAHWFFHLSIKEAKGK